MAQLKKGRNRALVIGVSKYPGAITNLPAVAADVREIGKILGSENAVFANDNIGVEA